MKNQATLKPIPCWYCKGKGSLESKPRPFGTPLIMMSVNVPCTQCNGTGERKGW